MRIRNGIVFAKGVDLSEHIVETQFVGYNGELYIITCSAECGRYNFS